ncbi:MAG: macro domain-containing protein [Promicromonosporaceae bacterium]|nr:macro domain-containing protein [Promicromonosporaceae bacterium]
MPLTFIRQDITQLEVDAIVNAANTELREGGGVCGAIFRAAGPSELAAACAKLAPIQTGQAVITPGFHLPAKYVIHAAGPVYQPSNPERSAELLRSAYLNSLRLATEHHLKSIAFPLISAGIYGYPASAALEVAVSAIRDYLESQELDVYLAFHDHHAFNSALRQYGESAQPGAEYVRINLA